jgi:voltage-gated potassium channel
MKTTMRTLLRIVGGLLSPTRALVEYLKPADKSAAARFIRSWNLALLFVAIAIWGLLCAVDVEERSVAWLLPMYLWVLPFSRVNEIFYAFLRDGLDRIKGTPEETGLTPYDRIVLVSRSYLEVIVDFGILYYLGFRDAFSPRFRDAVEAVYFSAITIATVGYGDLAPCRPVSQLLVVYEVLGGLVLIIVAFGAYIDKAAKAA